MKLILIHGRDQQGKDKEILKQTWIDTLKKGLAKNDLELPNVEIVFPFYGDMLDDLVKEANLPKDPSEVLAQGEEGLGDLYFFNSFLMEVATNAGITETEISENFDESIHERGPLNWAWVQAILKTLDKTMLGDWSLKKFTYDAFMYTTIPAIKRKINEFILEQIGNEPCLVVGHSLGSVVGYNVLRNCSAPQIKGFVTVGSPLGLRSFKQHLEHPIFMPKCISGKWYNAYDERDYVALHPLNNIHFKIDPAIENNDTVKNQTSNRHGIEGYLNDKNVAKQIYEGLL